MSKVTNISLWILILSLSACGLYNGRNPGRRSELCNTPQDIDGINAFKATLLPSLQQNCAQCHNSISPQAPGPFADDSPSIAYPVALPYSNFGNPDASVFVEKMRAQHNCATAGCATLASLFASDIAAWGAQQAQGSPSESASCSDLGDAQIIQTNAQLVPINLPDVLPSPNPPPPMYTLKFDLSQASPPVPGAVLQINLQRFTNAVGSDPGSYQLSNPTLAIAPRTADPDMNERITSLALLFDGQVNPSFRDWLGTDFIVKPRTFSIASPLSGWFSVNNSPQIVNWVSTAGDSISFRFRLSQTSNYPTVPDVNPFACKRIDLFTAFYAAKAMDCVGCHANSASPAYGIFPMRQSADAETCEGFKNRSNLADYTQSLFYLMPQNLIPGRVHPVTLSFSSTDQQNIQNWLSNEQ